MGSLEEFLVFKDVAQTKNITKTSKRLHMSQPCVSIQIQNLEKEYRAQLLDRTNRGVTLTPSGEIFYQYVEEVIQLTTEAQEAISKISADAQAQRIRIGASLTIGEYLLPILVSRYYQKGYAGINACICNTAALAQMVLERQLHLALIEGPVPDDPNLSVEAFWHDELVVVVPVDHPWSKRADVSYEELASESLITRERGSGTRKTMELAFEKHGYDIGALDIGLELSSTQAIKQAVKSGIGVAILSALTVQEECRLGQCAALHVKDCPLTRPLSILTHTKGHLTAPEQAFIFLLHDQQELSDIFPAPTMPEERRA